MFPREKLIAPGGQRLTQKLFWEISFAPEALFTFANREGMVPFKQLYIDYYIQDPTEYKLATEVFLDWTQWDRIRNNTNVKKYLDPIIEEAKIARKSFLFQEVLKEAKHGKSKFAATKYLIEDPQKLEGDRKQTKKNKQEGLRRVSKDYKDDIQRLMQEGHIN